MNQYTGIAAAAAMAAMLAATFWAGGSAPRARLAEFKAEVAAAGDRQKADNARRDIESARKLSDERQRHDKDLADSNARWNSRILLLQTGGGGTAAAVQVGTRLCNDPTGDARLSDALQRFATEVAGLLEVAERQAINYDAAVRWVNGAREIEGK